MRATRGRAAEEGGCAPAREGSTCLSKKPFPSGSAKSQIWGEQGTSRAISQCHYPTAVLPVRHRLGRPPSPGSPTFPRVMSGRPDFLRNSAASVGPTLPVFPGSTCTPKRTPLQSEVGVGGKGTDHPSATGAAKIALQPSGFSLKAETVVLHACAAHPLLEHQGVLMKPFTHLPKLTYLNQSLSIIQSAHVLF